MNKLGLEDIKKTYDLIEKGINLVQKDRELSYLDAFLQVADDLLENGKVYNENGDLQDETVAKLADIYQQIDFKYFNKEEIRQIIQLILLQAYRQERIQANHQMTPDSIGVLVEYLVEKLTKRSQKLELLDLAVGTGNLLETVMNRLEANGWQQLHGVGVDNDDTLLAIASVAAQFEQQSIDLIHQDSMGELPLQPANVVISDLPVGYYPIDDRVQLFETHASSGHSYVHHLMIEQSLKALQPGGFAIFVVPRGLFESQEAQFLLKYIQKVGYLQSLLNLPAELFASEKSQKSVLLLQKKGAGAHQAQQVLLGDFPSFKNKEEFRDFLAQIDQWISNEKLGLSE
ncbi:class I SAM-dependent methyltransferase [Ligilactobacillus pobuzihii]|uniref:Adenine-specific methyltransferase n=1 Tax=Ligilactobacillus pobuzihii TaxID=449659 RepID=A0A0R2LD34_9LACO|nr:class I SAM-dependent methyltransferase [Ligilactobacillus pobuzihii]KRK08983.1 adenine-specific methyltransferase [Ligilactobacillus pobuzihii E100301 = KCTC 13174]KRN99822.1 adenine-specific methyltransferase [Ligilactobacillus pobuzihii]GEN49299.1 DNA methyltransferase [Ligilactobacillus pobuzihii]